MQQCNAIILFHHYNWKLYLFLSLGDGMHAFMAYRVSTRVCGLTLIQIYFFFFLQFLVWPDYTMLGTVIVLHLKSCS